MPLERNAQQGSLETSSTDCSGAQCLTHKGLGLATLASRRIRLKILRRAEALRDSLERNALQARKEQDDHLRDRLEGNALQAIKEQRVHPQSDKLKELPGARCSTGLRGS